LLGFVGLMIKTYQPLYYKRFQCIGPECEDSCCTTNYEILISKQDYKFMLYKSKLKDQAKTVFEKTPNRDTYARIKLDEKGCCPLLTTEGWCSVYIADGEDKLPFVCRTYPRLQEPRGSQILENRLTLACPEAVRKVCFDEDAMQIEETVMKTKGALKTEPYQRPKDFQVIRDLTLDILFIPDAKIEETLYTLGVSLSSLAHFEGKDDLKGLNKAVNEVRNYVASGYPRVMFQQQASSLMHQSVFFSCCFDRVLCFLNQFPNTNRRLRALTETIKAKVPLMLQGEEVSKWSSVWLDLLAKPEAQQRYQDFMQSRPFAWRNYAVWHMHALDFPTGCWQVYTTRVVFLYVYFRTCMLILADDKPLDDNDFVLVVQSLHTAFHNKQMEILMKQIQYGFDVHFQLQNESGFSLSPLLLIK
jgi:hypothetical protein